MIAVILLLMIAGIGLTQAVSDPKQVTLSWLRLGGLISISLLAVAGSMSAMGDAMLVQHFWITFAVMCIAAIGQLMLVQLGKRSTQRGFAILLFLACVLSLEPSILASNYLAAGLLGGFLMTMLLGHAYLTADGEMTQQPFMRLLMMLMILLALRVLLSGSMGAWPYLQQEKTGPQTWNMMLITARYLVGILVPAIFLYMIHDCVKRSANQSATGILYVAGVLIIIGEGIALALIDSTGLPF